MNDYIEFLKQKSVVDDASQGFLFAVEAMTLQERQQARRESIADRVSACAALVNASDRPFLVWCNLNAESEALAASIPDAVEVQGSDSDEHKEQAIIGFLEGRHRVMISKPKIEATRTKALGLMHKQLCKDSTRSRAGIPQYLLAFRKDGENPEPVAHIDGLTEFCGENPPIHGNLSHERWRRYASPVWMDINFSNTLNAKAARENEDERHVCPMALDLIERAIQLWSNPGDVVFDPFSGIGSTGYQALKMGRKFVGSELKQAYFTQACKNIQSATSSQADMFSYA